MDDHAPRKLGRLVCNFEVVSTVARRVAGTVCGPSQAYRIPSPSAAGSWGWRWGSAQKLGSAVSHDLPRIRIPSASLTGMRQRESAGSWGFMLCVLVLVILRGNPGVRGESTASVPTGFCFLWRFACPACHLAGGRVRAALPSWAGTAMRARGLLLHRVRSLHARPCTMVMR